MKAQPITRHVTTRWPHGAGLSAPEPPEFDEVDDALSLACQEGTSRRRGWSQGIRALIRKRQLTKSDARRSDQRCHPRDMLSPAPDGANTMASRADPQLRKGLCRECPGRSGSAATGTAQLDIKEIEAMRDVGAKRSANCDYQPVGTNRMACTRGWCEMRGRFAPAAR